MKEIKNAAQFEQDVIRFMNYVMPEPMSGCWLWNGSKLVTGYGQFSAKRSTYKGLWRAHRFSWIAHGKELIDGLDLCHKCDNRLCVNPDHLWLGTRQENLLDCRDKKRNPAWNKTHCKHGHEYTKENTMIRYDGFRECRTCSDAHKRKHYEKMRFTDEFRRKNREAARSRRAASRP